jgi:hypothetical protein
VTEVQLDLRLLRCPRCAGDLVVRIQADESPDSLRLLIDSACASCGVSPWHDSDERTMLFRPGDPMEAPMEAPVRAAQAREAADSAAELSRAAVRVDGLLSRVNELERELEQARREVRRGEEATRGAVSPGLRAIELD